MFKTIYSTEGTRINAQKEAERLIIVGLTKRTNNSERGSPSFAQPNPKAN